MTREVPIRRILKNDYFSMLMLVLIGVTWFLAIFGNTFGFLPKRHMVGTMPTDPSMNHALLVIAIAISMLCGWLTIRRWGDIKRVIQTGPEIKGRISSIGFYSDRGRVEYQYDYQGKTYEAGNGLCKNRETTQLKAGDEIVLILDPEKPSRAFIASLYLTQAQLR
jgi:hypothetical protein